MKKSFTLFALLVAIVTGAWAQSTTLFEMKNVTGITKTDGKAAVEGTDYVGPGSYGSGSSAYTIAANNIGILNGVTVKLSATYDYNGKVEAYNGHSTKGNLTINTSTSTSWAITISNSGGSYLKVTLPEGTTIAQGDKITVTSNKGTKIRLTGEANKSKGAVADSWPYVVPSGSNLISESGVFYIMYNGGDMTEITSIKVERPSEDEVATPTVTLSGKQVTLACTTAESSIYYTLDGSEPTTSSTLYEEAFDLTNPCTVRAKAFKGENSSEENSQDCYFTHSDALKVLNYSEGTLSSDSKTWTSKSNTSYTIVDNNEAEGRTIGYANLAGSQDGFKLNHTDNYTITVPSYVKITKIVVVGKSWLAAEGGNNAATMAFDGFTPASGSFYEYPTGGTTYVKTLEFTPSEELEFGQSVTMRPGANQVGAYIEIYGEQQSFGITYNYNTEHGTISGPETAKPGETVTVIVTPDDGYELVDMHVYRASDNAGRDSYANPSVDTKTFTMLSYNVKVGAEFMPVLVDMPTESRTGYVVTKDGSEVEATTVTRSQSQMYNKKVYAIANGETVTLNVPAITNVARIVVSGVSSENQNSTITITGANEETASRTFAGRDNSIREAVLTPTTQTTSYTISSTNKGSWVQIKIYGEEAASEDLSLSNVTGKTYGFGGYCGSKNFTVTNGTAYKASFANSKVVLTSLDGIVPAGEGVVIAGTPGATATINFTDDDATVDMEGNNLHGTTVRTLTSTLKGEYAKFITLQKSTGKFIPYTGEYFPANRAYMLLDSEGAAQSFDIVFDSETGVDAVAEAKAELGVKKVVENGKLVISNNGKKYNAAGAVIK